LSESSSPSSSVSYAIPADSKERPIWQRKNRSIIIAILSFPGAELANFLLVVGIKTGGHLDREIVFVRRQRPIAHEVCDGFHEVVGNYDLVRCRLQCGWNPH